jgi:hypothetical protein
VRAAEAAPGDWKARAAEAAPGDWKTQVGREVAAGAWDAAAELAPKLPDDLQRELRMALFGLVPVVGRFGPVLSALEATGEVAEFRRTWIAAVMNAAL